ncbi:biotin synthase BioB [Haloimpatiens sp. FM7330]|uniref:biotin synthase BioB n=1 Tax=Haloimpatiens sp. FM7330 TaxID=3298610 RepID=UPI00362C3D47
MKNIIEKLEKQIYEGKSIDFNEAIELSKVEDLDKLFEGANRIREKCMGNKVELCSIINAKSGRCSEDCKYCAQSCHYNTNVDEYELIDFNKALKRAKENEEHGVHRFSLVTSGRALQGNDFEKLLDIYKKLKVNTNLKLCGSFGILTYENLKKLKEVGMEAFHHNLETSREYFNKICSTHTYEDRIKTIKNAQKAGLKVCSGGIIGMGETMVDRINMAIDLQKLNIKSIPINILTPIKGTPLENRERLSYEEILKTIAIFRFINPNAYIRYAGGRGQLQDFGKKGFMSGINAALTGNYLTTTGNNIEDDIHMIKSLGLEVEKL